MANIGLNLIKGIWNGTECGKLVWNKVTALLELLIK